MSIKFSIIVPSYNSILFIKKCLDSVIEQNYKNYELIVIDGGSVDGTIDLLKTYGDQIIWISEKDQGQADAINKGISLSSGDWITWQNCDDFYCNPNTLDIFSNVITSQPKKKLFIANINLVNSEEKILRDLKYLKPSFNSLLYEGMTLTNQACFWNKELNTSLGYLKKIRLNFDYEWFIRILKRYPDTGYHINETLACFRLHKDQKTQNQSKDDINGLKLIKKEYGYTKIKYFFIKPVLLIRKFFHYLFQGNFYYILRGIFKFFFGKKNKEYINN